MKTCNLEEMKDYLFAGFREMRHEIEMIKCMDDLKKFLLRKCSFMDYTIMADLAEHLQLPDAQKFWNEYTTFQEEMYEQILAEDFVVEAINENIKDHETKVCLHCESIVMKSL